MLNTSLPPLSNVFSPTEYNRLLSVESAYGKVQEHPKFEEFLSQIAALFNQFGCNQKFGAYLLHRHFESGNSTFPLEKLVTLDATEEEALVTKMVNSTSEVEYAPMRWQHIATLKIFKPIEYSADPAVIESWHWLSQNPNLLIKFGALLEHYGISDVIGFAIATRSLPKRDNEIYLEISDAKASASIVRAKSKDEQVAKSYIPTIWVPTKSCWCQPIVECRDLFGCVTVGSKHIGDPDGDHGTIDLGHKLVPCV